MEEQPSTVVQNTESSIQNNKTDASVSVSKRDTMTGARNTIAEEPVNQEPVHQGPANQGPVHKLKSETDDIDSAASGRPILVKKDIDKSE